MVRLILCVTLCVTLLYSCSQDEKAAQQTVSDVSLSKPTGLANNDASATDTVYTSTNVLQAGAPGANPDWDKKIIKTGDITLEVTDYKGYDNAIHAKVKSFGAYIAKEQQSQTDGQMLNNVSVKVPVDKFEDLMNSLGGEGIKVVEKNITSEDVTGEVVDTKARTEAKKQVRDTYLALLKQAKTMKDVLDVQNEVNSVQEDIEAATGRVNYLVHAAAYSTINIKYYQYINGITEKDLQPGFIQQIAAAFKTGGEIILNILLFFISVWPLTITAVFLVFYFKQKVKKQGA